MLRELKEGFVVTPEEQEIIDSFKDSILMLKDWKNLLATLIIIAFFMLTYCGIIILDAIVNPVVGG